MLSRILPSRIPLVMGILNVTPDSFSDGGCFQMPDVAVNHAHQMYLEGASIIDIGGESTRPGSVKISAHDQISRAIPVVERIISSSWYTDKCMISVDTSLSEVVIRAIGAGASMVNDVTAGTGDPEMLSCVAGLRIPIVLMHCKGTPLTMQDNPVYDNVLDEVLSFLETRINAALKIGILKENIIIDPGIGFGKTPQHNLSLLCNLEKFVSLGFPVLLGTSRKRFMGSICNEKDPVGLLGATVATTAIGLMAGVQIFRVHDVKPNRQAIDVISAINSI